MYYNCVEFICVCVLFGVMLYHIKFHLNISERLSIEQAVTRRTEAATGPANNINNIQLTL